MSSPTLARVVSYVYPRLAIQDTHNTYHVPGITTSTAVINSQLLLWLRVFLEDV